MEKDISEMACQYTLDEIKNKIKEMYPNMEEKEVNYHAEHVEDVDSLKVCDIDDDCELETVIKEQVEGLL